MNAYDVDPDDYEPDENVAMQSRCPHCLAEQYCLNVFGFSHGEYSCGKCGRKTEVMSYPQWRARMQAAYDRRASS